MEKKEIQIARYESHSLEVVVPRDEAVRDGVWSIIEKELSFNVITETARAALIKAIRGLKEEQNVDCVILGCTGGYTVRFDLAPHCLGFPVLLLVSLSLSVQSFP